MKKVLLISLLTVERILFGMDATSTNVAHLVEIPSENSLMYQKFNAVAAQTISEIEIPPYATNDADIVHCYDAMVNKAQKSGDIRYMYQDVKSLIWYDLVGTNNIVLTSDSVYFTTNSVYLSHDDSGIRKTGLLLSSITYDELASEAKSKYGNNAYITVEICFNPDNDQNFALLKPTTSAMTYPNRHTLFNMGFRYDTSSYVSQPGYFTLNNDIYPDSYVNYNQKPQLTFSTLSGYNVFYDEMNSLQYRELLNSYSIDLYGITTNRQDFCNAIYDNAGIIGSGLNISNLPPCTLVYYFSITNKTGLSGSFMTSSDKREDSFSLFLHDIRPGKYDSYEIGYKGINNGNGFDNDNALNGLQYESWSAVEVYGRATINKTESYCSFGGKYTRMPKSITENEMFYGHIYGIRIYISRNKKAAYDRRKRNVDIDRKRFFTNDDQ